MLAFRDFTLQLVGEIMQEIGPDPQLYMSLYINGRRGWYCNGPTVCEWAPCHYSGWERIIDGPGTDEGKSDDGLCEQISTTLEVERLVYS